MPRSFLAPPVRTVRDARAADDRADALGHFPEVGVLMRAGAPRYYATINGVVTVRRSRFLLGRAMARALDAGGTIGAGVC